MKLVTAPVKRTDRYSVLVIACLMASAPISVGAGDPARLIDVIAHVGSEGRGHREAAAAWRKLADADAAALPVVLGALDNASPLAANWLRSAAETIVDRQLGRRHPLPAAELESFIIDVRHAPRARRLAFE